MFDILQRPLLDVDFSNSQVMHVGIEHQPNIIPHCLKEVICAYNFETVPKSKIKMRWSWPSFSGRTHLTESSMDEIDSYSCELLAYPGAILNQQNSLYGRYEVTLLAARTVGERRIKTEFLLSVASWSQVPLHTQENKWVKSSKAVESFKHSLITQIASLCCISRSYIW